MFGPDKEYCQHFADTASAGRIKWTLFCSVCSKLKASQFICSRPRLTGASYSHRNAAEMWRQENKREFPPAQEMLDFPFVQGCTQMKREREVRTGSFRRGGEQLWQQRFIIQPAAVSCCLCSLASLHDKAGFLYAINACMFRERMGYGLFFFFFWLLAVSCSSYCRSTLQNKDGADGQGRDRSLGPERRTFRMKQGPEVVGSHVRPVGYYFHALWNW